MSFLGSIQTFLSEVGTLSLFKRLSTQVSPLHSFSRAQLTLSSIQTYCAVYDDLRHTEAMLKEFQGVEVDGSRLLFELQVPSRKALGPEQNPEPFEKEKSAQPRTPPKDWSVSVGNDLSTLTYRHSPPQTPSPFRNTHRTALPPTPPSNSALERLLTCSSPSAELLAAVRGEKSKWERYEQALCQTPRSASSSNLFRKAQESQQGPATPPPVAPLSGTTTSPPSNSKLVSFNSLKRSGMGNLEDWQRGPLARQHKGQDSVKYKQEVPQPYRFSLERLQRGRSWAPKFQSSKSGADILRHTPFPF